MTFTLLLRCDISIKPLAVRLALSQALPLPWAVWGTAPTPHPAGAPPHLWAGSRGPRSWGSWARTPDTAEHCRHQRGARHWCRGQGRARLRASLPLGGAGSHGALRVGGGGGSAGTCGDHDRSSPPLCLALPGALCGAGQPTFATAPLVGTHGTVPHILGGETEELRGQVWGAAGRACGQSLQAQPPSPGGGARARDRRGPPPAVREGVPSACRRGHPRQEEPRGEGLGAGGTAGAGPRTRSAEATRGRSPVRALGGDDDGVSWPLLSTCSRATSTEAPRGCGCPRGAHSWQSARGGGEDLGTRRSSPRGRRLSDGVSWSPWTASGTRCGQPSCLPGESGLPAAVFSVPGSASKASGESLPPSDSVLPLKWVSSWCVHRRLATGARE